MPLTGGQGECIREFENLQEIMQKMSNKEGKHS